jgi:hypothetical protein
MKVSGSSRTPPLSSAILEHIAADWDGFAEIRSAARALSQKSRLTNTLSIAVNEVRVALAAALLSTAHTASSATALSRDDEAVRLDNIERGMRLHAHARAVLSDCAGPLAREWLMSAGQIQKVLEAFGSVIGGFRQASSPAPAPVPTSPPRLLVEDYGQTVLLFLAAVAQGMAVADALAAFAQRRRSAADTSRTTTNASSRRTRYWDLWPIASASCTGRSPDSSAAVKASRT